MNKVVSLKLPKGVNQEFLDGIQSMSTDQLKSHIILLQLQNQENEEFKASRTFLHAQDQYDQAKASYNLVAGPIKDLTISIKNRTKLVIERLKERGGA